MPRITTPPAVTDLAGHTALVYSVAFSPDGKLLATGSFDDTIRLWDPAHGYKEVRHLEGHSAPVYCVAFSPDGKTLASASQDGTIRLWNVADGKPGLTLKGHTGIVDAVTFSPDGKLIASAGEDKTVRLWNSKDGKPVQNLGAHGKAVYALAFSGDGKWLASAGADGLVKIWNVATRKEGKTLKGQEPVTGVVFLPDHHTVASIGFDRYLHLWDAVKGTEVKKIGPTPDDLYGLALARDGLHLATSGYAGNVTVWDRTSGKPRMTSRLKFGAYCITFLPDGKGVLTGHDDGHCYVTPVSLGAVATKAAPKK